MLNISFRFSALASIALLFLLLQVPAAALDLVLSGGRVIDPETGLDAIRNIGIEGNRIVAVSSEPLQARQHIDVTGLVVSPGFIDMHAHGQSILSGRVQAFDGVTTALELESGTYPVSAYYTERENEGRPINYGASVNWLAVRISTLLKTEATADADWFGHAMTLQGWQHSIASEAQLQQMLAKVAQGLDEGGLGVGFLTGYAPGSGKKEYHSISQLAAKRQVPTFTHARFLSMLEPASSFEAIQEIVAVAASTGVQAHIVHLNSISLRDIDLIAGMIRSAQQRGVRLSTEAYPYGAGATSIGAAMFRGPDWRQRTGGLTAESFVANGKRLNETEFKQLQDNKPDTEIVVHFLELADQRDQKLIEKSLLMPGGVIASDGGDWLLDNQPIAQHTWPLPAKAFNHPRSAGTFTRFIRQYALLDNKLSLADAIAKVSLKPAQLLEQAVPQMKYKGRIQVGSDADIVVFSAEELADQASYEQPAQLSKGMKYVLVNGEILIRNEQLDTTKLPGKAVRNQIK